jgi:gamma-glutamyltranspeptidase/glutathione hydrolase
MGHHVVDTPRGGGFGGYQAIRINVKTHVLSGGSDPRKDGHAAGF